MKRTPQKWERWRVAPLLLVSAAIVALVTWFAPSLTATITTTLFRLRGELPAPDDISIVAIDDPSLQRIGRWPWPRSVMAEVLDRISNAGPAAIGLDVIYSEPSEAEEDRRLVQAVRQSGRVVLPAQLPDSETAGSDQLGSTWLRPLAELERAAAGVGHAHAAPDVDGVLRSIQLSKADERGDRLWAFGLEAVRVAEGIASNDIRESAGALHVGRYEIPVLDEPSPFAAPGITITRPNEMLINYVGPTRSFRYYSIADVLDGNVSPAAFRGRIVLIGAVAQSMGDTRVTPFMYYGGNPRHGGQGMPGIEVHANVINSIRERIWLKPVPEWMGFAAALLIMLGAAGVIRWSGGWWGIVGLGVILVAVTLGSFLLFTHFFVVPPLAPMLTAFITAVPLLLWHQTSSASRDLDLKLVRLAATQQDFLLPRQSDSRPAKALGYGADENDRRLSLPHNLAWKLRAVDDITAQLVSRMSFMNSVLASMTEVVIVAGLNGEIVFANSVSSYVAGRPSCKLIGRNLTDFLRSLEILDQTARGAAITRALSGETFETEFEMPCAASEAEWRYCLLSLSAVMAPDRPPDLPQAPSADADSEGMRAIGLIAIISDVTKRRELDQMKAETLQLVSHELRTPLTSIQGLSDVLLKFSVEAGEAQEMFSTIHSEAVRLGEIINRYLDLTRLESGAQKLAISPVQLNRTIASCLRAVAPLAAEKQIKITQQATAPIPAVEADEQLLTQAINNLLSNAIKYSPERSEVSIAAENGGGEVSVVVLDQGYGIPEADRERIFEKFYRLKRDTGAGIVGSGLGLPLVREIVERHGGHITVASAEGKGSTFTLHLPLRPVSMKDTPA